MHRLLAILIVFGSLSPAIAADPERNHDVTLDDYFTQAFLTDAVLSPDGTKVVYLEQRWEPPRETRNSELWLVAVNGGTPERLTFEFGTESNPQWAPDGKSIYYTASRTRDDGKFAPFNGKSQIWRLDLTSRQLTPVTRLEKGVSDFQLSTDGAALFYTTTKDTNEDPWKALQGKFDKVQYGHGKRVVSELWKLNLSNWREEKLVDANKYIHQFSVTPDGNRVAMITADDDELITMEGQSYVVVHNFQDGKSTQLPDDLWRKQAPSPNGWLASPAWSTDGSKLAFAVGFDGYPAEVILTQWNANQEPQSWRMKRESEIHISEARLIWSSERDLLMTAMSRARERVIRVEGIDAGKQGKTVEVTPGDVRVAAFNVAKATKRVVIVKAAPDHTDDVFVVNEAASPPAYQRLTQVNPQMRTWKLPHIELVKWKGADGDEVEGVLELPPGYQRDKKIPLIVDIHGGPTGDAPYCLRYWHYGEMIFAAKGYARLAPNYHGSTGYGDEFMTKLIGRENDIEVQDLKTGVDAMIKLGIADPDKLAVRGWSNGGFLTTALVAADTRYKAASAGAGVVEQFMQWGLEDTPGHVINFMSGKLPWQDPDAYRKASPAFQLNNVKTPVLIHVGENDPRVPAAHARTLHRALHRYLNVDTQLIVYPGEPHSLMKLDHRRTMMEWDHAWFDHYILGKPIPGEK